MRATRERGYQVGRDRREQIIHQATELFGKLGFEAATISDIAAHCGISRAGLLHHFATKEELLETVLRSRDAEDQARFDTVQAKGDPGLGMLRAVIDLAEQNSIRPGIVELYSLLAAEGTNPDHPAHAYFRNRYEFVRNSSLEGLERAQQAGYLQADADFQAIAIEILALMDGLQLQWLYEPEKIDMPGILRRRIQQLLTVPL